MMAGLVLFLALFLGRLPAGELTFRASELQTMAKKWAGSDANWKVITALAAFNAENNTFTLSDSDLAVLQQFSAVYKKQAAWYKSYADEITRGANVFVPVRLAECDSLFDRFQRASLEGNAAQVISLGPVLEKTVAQLAAENAAKRIKKVEARLSEKSGDVDRRKGLLGSWIDAMLNDLFVEEDGIRTAPASMARLSFVDGSDVIVEPSTVAIIRQSRLDQLTTSTETEITINNGAMLARLSSEMQQKSTFQVRASGSLTTVKSSKFFAERKAEDNVVTLANYNGTANVQANSKQVQLGENEGTIVASGRDPLPPVKLLPGPSLNWVTTDSVIFDEAITLAWSPILGSIKYQVDISSAAAFDHSVKTVSSLQPSITISGIALGVNYLRVRAYDKLGLRGVDSPVYRLLRNKDVMPPPVFIDHDPGSTFYVAGETLEIAGITEPLVPVLLNGKSYISDISGKFQLKMVLSQSAGNVVLKARDKSGNETVLNRAFVQMTASKMDRLIWSVPLENGKLPRTTSLSVSGTAYPVVQVQLKAGKTTVSADCGTEGQWAASFAVPSDARSLDMIFIDKRSGAKLHRVSFAIQ